MNPLELQEFLGKPALIMPHMAGARLQVLLYPVIPDFNFNRSVKVEKIIYREITGYAELAVLTVFHTWEIQEAVVQNLDVLRPYYPPILVAQKVGGFAIYSPKEKILFDNFGKQL